MMESFEVPQDLTKSTGPLILGYLANFFLFGVLTAQVYYYYFSFPNDKACYKIVVAIVYILELLQTIIISHDAFESFGLRFGNFSSLDHIKHIWLGVPIISGIATCIVQVFYAYRIGVLSNTRVIPCTIVVVSFIGKLDL